MKRKVDWIIHAVAGEKMNFHTHGAAKYTDQNLEFELNLNLAPDNGQQILNYIVSAFQDGRPLQLDVFIEEIFTMPFVIKKTKDALDGEDILRVILPDPNGLFPWDKGCQEEYASQYALANEVFVTTKYGLF